MSRRSKATTLLNEAKLNRLEIMLKRQITMMKDPDEKIIVFKGQIIQHLAL
jgi:hypothetical protein